MAKCKICEQRKGKRKCQPIEAVVCSQCCGTHRNEEQCLGCLYYKKNVLKRNYKGIERYSTQEMADTPELERIADVIETGIARLDQDLSLRDETIQKLLERLFDTYHFHDHELSFDTDQDRERYQALVSVIESELNKIPEEKLVKTLGAVYRSLRRRTKGNREYLGFIHHFFKK